MLLNISGKIKYEQRYLKVCEFLLSIRSKNAHSICTFCPSFELFSLTITAKKVQYQNICAVSAQCVLPHCTASFFSFKVVCIPTENGVPIPCNYANDTLMRCNCEFIKQQG